MRRPPALEECAMALDRVGARRLAGGQAVVDVPPMIGRDCGRIDVERLDRVDELEHVLHLRPAFELEQDVTARAHERQRLIGLARRDGAHDVDARDDRAEIVGGPADEREDAARLVGEDTPAAIQNLLVDVVAEPDPVFDLLLDPGQFDMGQMVGRRARTADGRLRTRAAAVPVMMASPSDGGIRARAARAACRRP